MNKGLLVLNTVVILAVAVFLYRKRRSPAWALFALAPMVGELLSSSSPPTEFFTPFVLVLAVMYGGGALLIREMLVRWRRGWPSLLALGIAYAIAEEGLGCKSFFDPNWMDLGAVSGYGRWLGLNSVWALGLTFYHALFSIFIPIALTHLLFPARRSEPWLSPRRFNALAIFFVLDIAFCFAALPSGPGGSRYYPHPAWVAISICTIASLILLARSLPKPATAGPRGTVARPGVFALLGFAGVALYAVTAFFMPSAKAPAVMTLVTMVLAFTGYCALIVLVSGQGAWDDRHMLALISGAFAPTVLFSFLREFAPRQADNPLGQSLVGIATIAFMVVLWRRVLRRSETGVVESVQGGVET